MSTTARIAIIAVWLLPQVALAADQSPGCMLAPGSQLCPFKRDLPPPQNAPEFAECGFEASWASSAFLPFGR